MDDVRQHFQGGRQDNKTIGSDKTNFKNPIGTSNDDSNTNANTSELTGPSAKNKISDQLQNKTLNSGSSISDAQKRLGGKDLDKGNLSTGGSDKGVVDKSEIPLGKIKGAPGGITTDSQGKALNSSPADVKQRLGLDNLERKREGADLKASDLNLNKKTDTPSLKRPVGDAGPGLTAKTLPFNLPKGGDTKIGRDDMLKSRFPDRLKSGELDKVTKGDIAQKLKLSDQFHMMQQGDVARRMELQKHANNFADVKNIHAKDIHQL